MTCKTGWAARVIMDSCDDCRHSLIVHVKNEDGSISCSVCDVVEETRAQILAAGHALQHPMSERIELPPPTERS